jgi:putative intracellular protease/amidase
MPKILLITGDAAEDLEVMYPYQRLLEEGYEVYIAAPTAKKLQFVVHDFAEGFDTYTEKPAAPGRPTSRSPTSTRPATSRWFFRAGARPSTSVATPTVSGSSSTSSRRTSRSRHCATAPSSSPPPGSSTAAV